MSNHQKSLRFARILAFSTPTFVLALMFCPSCSTPPPTNYAEPVESNEYTSIIAKWSAKERRAQLQSAEDFFAGVREGGLAPRGRTFEANHPVLSTLKVGEPSIWFGVFFETLVGAQLMAKSNSFRSYDNVNCYESFVRPLSASPLPPAAELMPLHDFLVAGPRIPDENTYIGQVRLYCGRRSINLFQQITVGATPESQATIPAQILRIHLSLKNNLVLQKLILARAAAEAEVILNSYRGALN